MRDALVALVRMLLRLFFSRVEVEGAERVPIHEPCIFVLNHPNGLVDPMVVMALAPRPVAFLAKSTLFALPLLGAAMRSLDCLPVYRHQDAGSDTSQNQRTFAHARALLARGGSIALFPEGTTHSHPHLLPVKTGAARIALGTVAQEPGEGLWMVPAGLYYTAKGIFRSKVLLVYGTPLRVEQRDLEEAGEEATPSLQASPPVEPPTTPPKTTAPTSAPQPPAVSEPPRAAVARLSARIQEALGKVALQAGEQRILDQVAVAQRLFSSTDEETSLYDELCVRQNFVEGYKRLALQDPARLVDFERRLLAFDQALAAAGLSYADVVVRQDSTHSLMRTAGWGLLEFVALAPFALVGIVLHAPVYEAVALLARRATGRDDTVLSTYKLGASVLLYPILWAGMAWVLAARLGIWSGVASVPLAWLCALAALRLMERAERGSRGLRSLVCFLSRRGEYARLVEEQSRLRDEFRQLGEAMGLVAGDVPA